MAFARIINPIKSFLKLFEKDAPKIEVEEVSDVPNRDTSVEEKLIYLASCINANGCINVKDDSGKNNESILNGRI